MSFCWTISLWPPSEEFWRYKASWSSLVPQAESLSLFCLPLPALQNLCKRLVIIICKYPFLVCDNKKIIKDMDQSFFNTFLPCPSLSPFFNLFTAHDFRSLRGQEKKEIMSAECKGKIRRFLIETRVECRCGEAEKHRQVSLMTRSAGKLALWTDSLVKENIKK